MSFRGQGFQEQKALRLQELKRLGEIVSDLLCDQFEEKSPIHLRLEEVKSVADLIATEVSRKKLELSTQLQVNLRFEDCEALERLVHAEGCHYQIKQCCQTIEEARGAQEFKDWKGLNNLFYFFEYLESYLNLTLEIWDGEPALQKQLNLFFYQIVEDLEAIKTYFIREMSTERIWEDCPIDGYSGTPLEVYCWEEKLQLVSKLRLLDLLIACFKDETLHNFLGFEFNLDPKLEFFTGCFGEKRRAEKMKRWEERYLQTTPYECEPEEEWDC